MSSLNLYFDVPGRLREYSWDYFINHDIRIPEPEPTRMTHGFRKGPRSFLTVAHLEESLDDFQRSEWWRNIRVLTQKIG